jgi:hypothetical protein
MGSQTGNSPLTSVKYVATTFFFKIVIQKEKKSFAIKLSDITRKKILYRFIKYFTKKQNSSNIIKKIVSYLYT